MIHNHAHQAEGIQADAPLLIESGKIIMNALPHPAFTALICGLTPQQTETVSQSLKLLSYPRDSIIFHTGEPATMLYVVVAGIVKKTYGNARGDEQILNFYQVGDLFGQLFLGKYHHRIGSAIAMTNVQVAALTSEALAQLVLAIPQLGLNLIGHYANEQRETLARMHALRQADARHRLLGMLLTLARRTPANADGWHCLPEGITQADIANVTGLNRSTTSVLINTLRRQGVLGGSGRVLIVHRARVEFLLEEAGLEILE
jgi:CRP-like cAMP-binding protein